MKKKIVTTFLAFLAAATTTFAQVTRTKTIDNGGSGAYKAVAVTEATLPDYVVYRPSDIKEASRKEGKLPVVVFANGGCSNTSITHEKVLSQIASQGYVIIAIGPLQLTPNETQRKSTEAAMLISALDWMAAQSKDSKSEYYNQIDLTKVASAGQSCGGAQVLGVAKDKRIKASIMFNSGIGDMAMAGATKEQLTDLHSPYTICCGWSF